MHYVIGDVHGCYHEFIKLIKKIEREDRRAHFILIGDVIDRGPDTPAMADWCMKHVKPDGKYQMLLGNHELLFLEWCSKEYFPYCEGKKQSYEHAHYGTDTDLKEGGLLTEAKVRELYEFFRKLPLVKEKEVISPDGRQKYVLAHAWARIEEMEEIRRGEKKPEHYWKTFLIDRSGVPTDAGYDPEGAEILIHGHTPTTDEEIIAGGDVPGRICYRNHVVNVDCGMCYGTYDYELPPNLAAICLENLKEYYAYTLEEWYEKKKLQGEDAVRQAVYTFKRKYHYSRPDLMRLRLIKQINGAKI